MKILSFQKIIFLWGLEMYYNFAMYEMILAIIALVEH
jgi:hypothetical protein